MDSVNCGAPSSTGTASHSGNDDNNNINSNNAKSSGGGAAAAAASNDWLRCCNACVSGRVSLLTNCGHLVCARCLDVNAESGKRCPVCRRPCSSMNLHSDLTGLPAEIQLLFQPVDTLITTQQRKLQQVIDFQRSQQNRLIGNLKEKMRRMGDKWNTLIGKAKSQEEELRVLRQEVGKLREWKRHHHQQQRQPTNHPHPFLPSSSAQAPSYPSINSSSSISSSSSSSAAAVANADDPYKQFLMNFTPLKNEFNTRAPAISTNAQPSNQSLPSSSTAYSSFQNTTTSTSNHHHHHHQSHQRSGDAAIDTELLSPAAAANGTNPNVRMSVRTPLSVSSASSTSKQHHQVVGSGGGRRTPSPYQLNTSFGSTIMRSGGGSGGNLHNTSATLHQSPLHHKGKIPSSSFTTIQSSTPSLTACIDPTTPPPHPRPFKSHDSHHHALNRPLPTAAAAGGGAGGNESKSELKQKASSALMRLSQSLAAKSLGK